MLWVCHAQQCLVLSRCWNGGEYTTVGKAPSLASWFSSIKFSLDSSFLGFLLLFTFKLLKISKAIYAYCKKHLWYLLPDPFCLCTQRKVHLQTKMALFFFFYTLNFSFCIGLQPINSIVVVSGEQRRDSATRIHVSILPNPPSYPGCHITLSRVPCATH